jgi:hypothetical protein
MKGSMKMPEKNLNENLGISYTMPGPKIATVWNQKSLTVAVGFVCKGNKVSRIVCSHSYHSVCHAKCMLACPGYIVLSTMVHPSSVQKSLFNGWKFLWDHAGSSLPGAARYLD